MSFKVLLLVLRVPFLLYFYYYFHLIVVFVLSSKCNRNVLCCFSLLLTGRMAERLVLSRQRLVLFLSILTFWSEMTNGHCSGVLSSTHTGRIVYVINILCHAAETRIQLFDNYMGPTFRLSYAINLKAIAFMDHYYVCVCVRACVRACVRGVRVCVFTR